MSLPTLDLAPDLRLLPLMTAVFAITTLLRALRLGLLLEPRPPWRPLLGIQCISFFAFTALPLRLGELVRPALLKVRLGVPLTESVAVSILERWLDAMGLLALLLVSGAGGGAEAPLRVGRQMLLGAAAAGLVGLVTLVIGGETLLGAIDRALVRLPAERRERLVTTLRSFARALGTLAHRPLMGLATLATTLTMWTLAVLQLAIALRAFGVEASAAVLTTTWASIVLTVMVATTPVNLGSFEAGGIGALVVQGVDATTAGAAVASLHAILFAHALAAGAAFAWLDGLPLLRPPPLNDLPPEPR